MGQLQVAVGAARKPRAHNYFLNGRKEAWGYRLLKVFDAARRSRPIMRVAYPFIIQTKPVSKVPTPIYIFQ